VPEQSLRAATAPSSHHRTWVDHHLLSATRGLKLRLTAPVLVLILPVAMPPIAGGTAAAGRLKGFDPAGGSATAGYGCSGVSL
jgi:hypothetical protein